MSKVFLSYSRVDSAFVEELYRRLMRDGVDCFYDQESIAWGANWVRELEKGIDECESIVVVLTDDFVRSKWTELERTGAIADNPDGLRQKMRPLLRALCEVPRFLKPIQAIDVTTDEKFEAAYPRICKELGGVVRADDELPVDRSRLPPVARLPRRYRMPYRSLGRGFAGRVADLWALHDLFVQSATAVVEGIGLVIGIGGLGKTQLATEYVHRFASYYPGGVFWTDADQGLPVVIGQIAGAAGIDIDGTLPIERQREQLWRVLTQSPALVLIVLDNFPETGPLEPWLPIGANIRTVVTTRRRDLSRHPKLSLDYLNESEGLELLNGGERRFGTEAIALVEALGGLPLALELARNFLNLRLKLTVEALLEEMAALGDIATLEVFETHYADELPTGHVKAVSATFQLSWDLASLQAQQILKLMALWAPAPVPRRLLRRALGDENGSRLTDPIDASVAELARLSLVELDDEMDPQAHRLISGFVAMKMADGDELKRTAVEAVVGELARARDDHDTTTYSELEKVLPHGESLIDAPFTEPEQGSEIAEFLSWHHRDRGRYRLAEQFGRRALKLAITAFEPGHLSIARSQSNLATVLKNLGELAEARDLLRQALASDEQSFEPGHPSIAIRQSNLATVLKDLGELAEARDLLRQALASAEQSFEPGHPSIASSQSNLALVLQDLGELAEARDLLRQALASAEQSFEPGHPSIAINQSNLATVLKDLGELAEARDLLRQALASDEQSFEPGHPSIARSQSNLAVVLKDLGELAEARDLLRQALASAEQSFEPGHPSIARSQSNLAQVLKDFGELAEARDLLRQALASDEQSFEPGHPSIARRQSNLATVLKDLGELAEARDLLRQALASDEQSFEPGHPSIARRQSNLAQVLQDLGELAEARDLLRQALASDEQSFEPGHPSIARRQSNLAQVLQDLGELAEARDLLRQALASAEQSFEPGHPSIAIRQSNLAAVLQDLGELAEARDLLRQALASAEQSFEPGHPSIAIWQSNLATVLKDLGELEEAHDLLLNAYASLRKKFGEDHPMTKTVKGHLGAIEAEMEQRQ